MLIHLSEVYAAHCYWSLSYEYDELCAKSLRRKGPSEAGGRREFSRKTRNGLKESQDTAKEKKEEHEYLKREYLAAIRDVDLNRKVEKLEVMIGDEVREKITKGEGEVEFTV